MADVSSVDMALSGIGLATRKPNLILGWGGLLLAFSLVIGIAVASTIGPDIIELARREPGSSDPTAAVALLGRVAPMYCVLLIVALAFGAVISVSCYRAMLRPEEGAPFYLSFGGPEMRQFLLYLILSLIAIGVYIAAIIAGIIVGGIGGVIGKAIGGVGGGLIGGLIIAAAVVGCIGALIFVAVRLSLSPPATFARGELVVFRAWPLTRGKFWALFGGYALNVLCLFVAEIVIVVVLMAATTGGINFAAYQQMSTERISSVAAYLAPMSIVLMVITSLVGGALYALILAPAAYAYQALTGGQTGPAV